MKKTHNITDRKYLEKLVCHFTQQLSDQEVIWLTGPLGIGKSEWVRLSLKHIGYQQTVPSPSFAIHHEYFVKQKKMTHIDLYRVKTEEDLESIGFFDLFLEEKGIIFVEWADRVTMKLDGWVQTFLNFYWDRNQRMVSITSESEKNLQKESE